VGSGTQATGSAVHPENGWLLGQALTKCKVKSARAYIFLRSAQTVGSHVYLTRSASRGKGHSPPRHARRYSLVRRGSGSGYRRRSARPQSPPLPRRSAPSLELENEPRLVAEIVLIVVPGGEVVNETRQKIIGFDRSDRQVRSDFNIDATPKHHIQGPIAR
jgi:hypothetical protein